MTNEVYANGREVACKAAAGKTIAAFPDTCLSPPSPPAGPLPVPYPNTAYASDTTNGSTTVMISGQEVMLKDSSTFKTSTGNEAATKSLGMGALTHTIQGEASFISWSMDVKIEGQNVDRHLDMTVHNEQSKVAQTPPFPYADRMASIKACSGDCDVEIAEIDRKCKPWPDAAKCPPRRNLRKTNLAVRMESNECQQALRCATVPFRKNGKSMCCPGQTPDHIVPASMFFKRRRGGRRMDGCSAYSDHDAPCVCAEGGKSQATHGMLGRARKRYMGGDNSDKIDYTKQPTWKLGDAAQCAGKSTNEVFPQCRAKCIQSQVLKQHEAMKPENCLNPDTEIKTDHEDVLQDLEEVDKELAKLQLRKAARRSVFYQ